MIGFTTLSPKISVRMVCLRCRDQRPRLAGVNNMFDPTCYTLHGSEIIYISSTPQLGTVILHINDIHSSHDYLNSYLNHHFVQWILALPHCLSHILVCTTALPTPLIAGGGGPASVRRPRYSLGTTQQGAQWMQKAGHLWVWWGLSNSTPRFEHVFHLFKLTKTRGSGGLYYDFPWKFFLSDWQCWCRP